jgi:hypothetical protein
MNDFTAAHPRIRFTLLKVTNLHAKTAGEYTFRAMELKDFEAGTNVILWDKKANIKQNLGLNPTYKFTTNAGVEASRFELLFDTPLAANEQGLTVFPNPVIDDKTTLQIATNELNDLAVKVYDVMGRVVLQETYKKGEPKLYDSAIADKCICNYCQQTSIVRAVSNYCPKCHQKGYLYILEYEVN